MRLCWLLSLPAAVLSVTSFALAIERRDADFFSVRTSMHKDMSGRRGDPKGKYFRESLSLRMSGARQTDVNDRR
jgi:hypothetical protein